MATTSAAAPYSPPSVSPTFPTDVTSTPPQASPEEQQQQQRERRTSQKRVAAPGYPTPGAGPLPPMALAPRPPQAAPPAATRPFIAYDPSLVIPPFNPNKRRTTGAGAGSAPQAQAPAPTASRRESVQGQEQQQQHQQQQVPAQAQFSAQQQQHYQQQWAQLQLRQQQAQAQALAQQAHQAQMAQQTQPQRPVSVMPAMPRYPTPQDASTPQYPAFYAPAPAPAGPGGSVSSRARQSVGYLPSAAPSSSSSSAAATAAAAAQLAGQGPYPHLYTPHPLPRQKVYFGPYVLLQTLGEGEFGKVKLGVHGERWGEDVAIKLIKRGNVDTVQRGEKVRREIEVLKMVRHPNIVRLYDVIETEKYIGIVLEYASGGELFDHILAHRYLKERDASRLFAQLVSGVSYLHAKGVVHRDLKLENLLLDRNRNVIITDFGFANRFNDARTDLMATSCGSPCYAAPELVVSDGKYVGTAVDVWSCGVILYAMLAGYLPYDDDPANPEGDNINLLYRYILSTPLTFPDWITDEPRGLLLDMLVAEPERRCTIGDVTRHSWLRRYAPAFDKTVPELEHQAQEMERYKRQALEIQRQWLVAQQQQQALAAQGLLAPSMTRSQTATSGMGGGGPVAGQPHLSASMGPGVGVPQQQQQQQQQVPLSVAQQRHRSAMVTSASTAAVSAPLAQHGFEHYSLAQPSPSIPASVSTQAIVPPLSSPTAPPSPLPASGGGAGATAATAPEPPVSPRTRTISTGVIMPVPHPSNPNRRSGAYTVSSSPPTTQTEFASANAGPFSFAAAAGANGTAAGSGAGAASVPMQTSLSAPAAPSRAPPSSSAVGAGGGGGEQLATLSEDALMLDRTPSPASLASAPPSRASSTRRTSTDEDTAAAAQRRRKAANRATLQVEYDGGAGMPMAAATRRRGASKEPGLATAVEGLGLEAAPLPAIPAHRTDEHRLEVPGAGTGTATAGRNSPSPAPSKSAVSVSTTTETHQGEDVVMQSVDEQDEDKTATPSNVGAASSGEEPPLAPPVPFPAAVSGESLAASPRKRKSTSSPASSIRPAELPLPPTPSPAPSTSSALADAAAPQRTQPKTSAGSQASAASQPVRPPSAASSASRHRHTASADRFSLRSLLGTSASQPPTPSATAAPPVLPVPPLPPVPTKDAPLDEVTNRRKAGRRQKAMSLQPFRNSVSSKLPKGARNNVEAAAAAAAASATGRERASTVNVQGETIQPAQAQTAAVKQQPPSRPPSSSRADSGSLASKRFSTDLEANWGSSSTGPTPSGKAKAVMDWFRRKSSRNEAAAPTATPPPIQVDFDRRSSVAAGPASAPLRSSAAATSDAPGSSNTSLRDATAPVAAQAGAPQQDAASNPSVVVTRPLPAAPQAQPHAQEDPAPRSQISNHTASTLGSSVGSSTGVPAHHHQHHQQQQPVVAPMPPAFVPTKLRFHQGALDKNAVTYRAPNEVLADIKHALWNMGVEMAMEGEYKIKCVRKSRKKALASSVGSNAAAGNGAPASAGLASSAAASGALDRRNSLASSTSLAQSPSMGFRSLFGKKQQQQHGPGSTTPSTPNFSQPGTPSTQDTHSAFDPLSSPMTTSVSQFSMLSLSSPQPLPVYGGDKSADAGDEVRFVVELTRVKNLDRLYCVDVKRMKGMAWSFKHVYDQLVGSLELGPTI